MGHTTKLQKFFEIRMGSEKENQSAACNKISE
jgi:hypothetical protein